MNAAARAFHRGSWFQGSIRKMELSTESWGILVLISLMLISAFAVVYVKDFERRLFSDSQSLQQERDSLDVEWGQLLLEQSTWANPSRIQQIANGELRMALPNTKQITMVVVN